MAVIKAKPTSPGRRGASYYKNEDITRSKGEKRLLVTLKSKAGRNNQGKITIRHRGGGVKRKLRIVDFKRDKFDVPAIVKAIEYDPTRGARVALVYYKDGEKKYIVAPEGLKVNGEVVSSKEQLEYNPGNAMPLKFLQAGIPVHNIEVDAGKGGRIARGAGSSVFVMSIDGKYAQIKMPSGEIRLFDKECLCTIGVVGNSDRRLIKIGKAGRNRYLGKRPVVRGSAMNPVDHPHGGGEGNQPIGLRRPKTPWGKPALGVKTRNPNKASNRMIIKRRKKK